MYLRNQFGFTLIETIIAIAIVSILAVIAYPSYQESVLKARRTDAKESLVELRQYMESYYTLNNRYDQDQAGTSISLPFTQTPKDGSTKHYDLAFQGGDPGRNTFTLTATPISNDTKCTKLLIDQLGNRTYMGSGTKKDCW